MALGPSESDECKLVKTWVRRPNALWVETGPSSSLFLDVIVLHDSHPRRVRAVQPGLPPASHNVPHDRAVKAREILLLPLVYRRGHRASGSLRIPLQVTQLGSSRPVLPSCS